MNSTRKDEVSKRLFYIHVSHALLLSRSLVVSTVANKGVCMELGSGKCSSREKEYRLQSNTYISIYFVILCRNFTSLIDTGALNPSLSFNVGPLWLKIIAMWLKIILNIISIMNTCFI